MGKDNKYIIAIFAVVFIIMITIAIGDYYLKRWWNWNWSYEDQSIELIQEMVKPECLIGDKENG